MKAQSPLLGFNNNVRHKGRVFHIQTEDSGVKHPHVITHLFADGGRIVRSQKTSYAEFVGDEELQRKVRSLMQEQHKAMFIALRAGKFDHLLETVPVTEPPADRASQPGPAPTQGRPPMESTVSIEIGNPGEPGAVVHVAPGQPIPPSLGSSPGASEKPAAKTPTPAPPPAPQPESKKRPSPRPAALAITEAAMQEVRLPEETLPSAIAAPRPPTLPPPSFEASGPDTEVVRHRPGHILEGDPSIPGVVHVASTGTAATRSRSPSQGLRRLTPPPPLPSNTMPGGVRAPQPTQASATGTAPTERAAARPPSMIPPSAKPLSMPPPLATGPTLPAVAAVNAPIGGPPPEARSVPRRNSGLLAALGALSSGAKAPSLGASPGPRPAGSSLGVPPRIGANAPASSREPAPSDRAAPRQSARAPESEGKPVSSGRGQAEQSSLDLDLQALERAAEQGNSPVYRQVRDFPAPPQALRNLGHAHARSITPGAGPSTVPTAPPSQPSIGGADRGGGSGPASGNRYAPSRPAAIFGASRPQEGASIFGEDLISEKSLDEVILSYLAEDLDAPKK